MELPKEMLEQLERQTKNGPSTQGNTYSESKPRGDPSSGRELESRRASEEADDLGHSRDRHGRGGSRGRSRSASSGRRRRGGGRRRGRSRSRDRRRTYNQRRRSRSPPPRRAQQPMTEEEAKMRDARCVFVSQLQVKATEEDVEFYFSLFCKVAEVALIREKATGRSKGFGYVELETMEDVTKALMLSGLPFVWRDGTKGFPLVVRPSEAHKLYLVSQGLAQPTAAQMAMANAAKVPQANIELVEMIGPATCRARVDGGPIQVLPMHKGKPINTRLLYVGNLHKSLTENDVRDVFSAFGAVENVQLKVDPVTKQSKGFAFVKFKESAATALANERMNGYELMGFNLACNPVNDKQQQQQEGGGGRDDTWTALDDGDSMDRSARGGGGGISLQASRRVELMSKLAGGAAQDMMNTVPSLAQPAPGQSSTSGGRRIAILNMFDPETETAPNWEREIERDTHEECEKFGRVLSCEVDRSSRVGRVLVTFQNAADASRAAASLSGRWFAQRQVQVDFV